MVGTRGATRRERDQVARDPQVEIKEDCSAATTVVEKRMESPTAAPSVASATTRRSKGHSATSSVKARRAQLVLDAAKLKAQIRMEIIDKQLEADLAQLEEEEDEYSPQERDGTHNVEQWLEKSRVELMEPAPEYGHPSGQPHQLYVPAADIPQAIAAPGPTVPRLPLESQRPVPTPHLEEAPGMYAAIQTLATAVKDLATASEPNNKLMSRLCAPKQLPEYAGDPLEWLQFKQAYDESTELCQFTPQENIWRLRKCLRGAAKEAVAALLCSASPPSKIMSTLELRFGNPEFIISKIVQDIQKVPAMSQDYHTEIVQFSVKVENLVEAVRAVGREEHLKGMSIVSQILSKLPTLLLSKWSDYSFPLLTSSEKPRLVILSEFLHQEAIKISSTSNLFPTTALNTSTSHNKQKARTQTILLQSDSPHDKCQFCHTSKHSLTDCKKFRKALCKTRWQYVKRNGICYKCLISRHKRDECTAPVCDKDGCGRSHHQLLHYGGNNNTSQALVHRQSTTESSATSVSTTPSIGDNTSSTTQTVTHINASECKVLLKVVPIRLHTSRGVFSATALIDLGSTVSLLSADLAKRAGVNGWSETMRIRGAWSGNDLTCQSVVANVNLTGMDNKVHSVKVRCVDNLDLPIQHLSIVNCNSYKHLADIKDSLCTVDIKPELLLGMDNYHILFPIEVRLGKVNEPSATLTPLGWCMHGMVHSVHGERYRGATSHATLLVSAANPGGPPAAPPTATATAAVDSDSSLRELHEEVRRLFAVDALGVTGKPRQNINDLRAIALIENTTSFSEGRWHVGLPWKNEHGSMPNAYPIALKRLKGMEKKMKQNAGFAERYRERIDHLLKNDYAKKLEDFRPAPRTWYLPHFGVDNPNKKKLRLVFDAAAAVDGKCLNDFLYTGPDLLSSLLGIMLRFRENAIAVTGDIADMYLRVKLRAEDQHAFRFLWRDSPSDSVDTYVMTSLVFGANCSPFVAQFVKNLNARRFESSLPDAVNAIYHSHYVDDYIDSLPDSSTAIEMVKNISHIHKEGGFHIRNWTSNCTAVLDSVPKETLGNAALKFKIDQQYEGERTLGLVWYPGDDKLGFDTSMKRIPENIIQGKERPTKRIMLRVVMSIFDVLGFLSPFTIQGKIMLQDTWRLSLGWDDFVPDEIYKKWCKWIELLNEVERIRIPRWYCMDMPRILNSEYISTSVSLSDPTLATTAPVAQPMSSTANCQGIRSTTTKCGSDATTTQSPTNLIIKYTGLQLHVFSDASVKAMCAVAYWRWVENGETRVAFIASKCRVVPVRSLTVPRAELQAALLAARLAATILKEHRITPEYRFFWCDSTTVLQWIKNNKRSYKTFEANRLGEIDELTKACEWRYVPTKLNVADLATREEFDKALFQGRWFTGPEFLYDNKESWPADIIYEKITDIECLATVVESFPSSPIPDPRRFSCWLRLLRSTAVVLKFIDKCRKVTGRVDSDAMAKAEILLLKFAQADSFPIEISAIKKGKYISKDSRLITLSPYLDENGLLRLGGRIDVAPDLDLEAKRPIILDGKHPVARLLVRYYHIKAAHGNQEMVVNNLKQKYWILRMRPTVKTVASSCMLCRLRKSKPEVPRMGDLPEARVAHHQRPFSFCGLDLFGPMEVTVGRSRQKRYGVLFTCLTVRAVHIEVVPSLTTDSLIMALRRMAARRGWPAHLYSDNGTNLRGADKELQQAARGLDVDALIAVGANNSLNWHFIPPASPHWGGAWERLIRSVKDSLRVIMTERAPQDEVLNTLLAEVENIINSRPLTHVSVDPDSQETLTPNHFLLGSSSNLPVIGTFDEKDLKLRKYWRKAQFLADMFWRRWMKEVLPDLLPRRKWNQESLNLKVGDLVLVVDPDSPRNTWPKGLVLQVYPGKDGRIRLVDVKTKTGVWKRSAARVARIPLGSECCTSTGVGSVSDALI